MFYLNSLIVESVIYLMSGTMGIKKQSRGSKKSPSMPSSGITKQFQLLNGVITKEDITPLSKSQRTQVSSDEESVDSADLLFSPIGTGAVDEEEEEDEYDHGLLSPIYFGAMYPRRFHHHSIAEEKHLVDSRRNSVSAYALRDLVENTGNNDFWKEVSTTNQEAIFTSSQLELPAESACVEESPNTSLDEFISADLGTPTAGPLQWDEDYKIKLLCYRDSTGNLRLRTQEDNYTVSKNSTAPFSKVKVGKSRKGKGRKLLKNAIRRKSGVREMVSTGIGIGEFML